MTQPHVGEPFFMSITERPGRTAVLFDRDTWKYACSDSLDSLEVAISMAKEICGRSVVYYCVPVGEADEAHSHMMSTLEVLGSAALGLEGGGYDSTEGTALTG